MQDLKDRYTAICEEYIAAFEEKQELCFDGWVADRVGELACFDLYYFNFSDIVWDINTEQKAGLILEWHEEGGGIN